MKRKIGGLALLGAVASCAAVGGGRGREAVGDGARTAPGSTFVSPLVSVWTPALGSAYDYTIQYSAVGSGGGIQAISNRSVDFGASDAPMTPDQFSRVQRLRADPVGARRHRHQLQHSRVDGARENRT